jgi:hypothetical protein
MSSYRHAPSAELFAKCYEQAERQLQSGYSLKFAMSHAIRTAYDAGHADTSPQLSMNKMTEQHPIQPGSELRQLWAQQAQQLTPRDPVAWMQHVSIKASQWGADVQLKETLEYIKTNYQWADEDLEEVHDAMRPKPLTKQQKALLALDAAVADGRLSPEVVAVVREALV